MKSKVKKICISFIIIILAIFTIGTVYADVGSFESYHSSSSKGSSSYSSGYSGSYESSYSSGSGDTLFLLAMLPKEARPIVVITFIILGIIGFIVLKNTKGMPAPNIRGDNDIIFDNQAKPDILRDEALCKKIQQIDPLFNKEEFLAWSKNLFVKLQQAWTDRDWSTIRTFETNELYEQHKNQLQGYINNNQINVMDRICVNFANLYDFRQYGDKDIVVVRLNSRMADYIIDATTKKVLKGNKNLELTNTYLLTFVRSSSIKTEASDGKVKTTNCPNCGAPTEITSSGKCEYCGSVITNDEHTWVLANLEREIR